MEVFGDYELKQSKIFRDFDKAYSEGKLDYLKQLFLPYILNNIADFYQFKKEKLKQFAEALDMHQLLKLYLYYKQMPIDMHRYMEEQSQSIKKVIANSSKERQTAVSEWIKQHAARHRDVAIKNQCLFFEKIADQVIPPIEKALREYEANTN
ncbi:MULTISPECIES: hypothetical protein [Fibrobacter]|uniref:Uncharacterized protein n=1 Tax=Fibrobacter intestinalis TaxID=28122 RepID=A0A1T4JRD3_9BACT|nr:MULTISPECIES: hypothetical protein [Fibrobacter]MDD7297914.1 hypothetical protein [Fibrobacter intestinalis]PBC68881.1 hypothetical protein BGX14_1267 [Fibrobacter sp. UWS1]PBC74124.1 hypothetical protein BGW94_1762 [Fibrobacter sp. NR9]SJZ32701.1 hypothetical protein SAMN02745108_00042 [Fibrobacter intestinalis]